jgi:hypothetical protein
MAETLFSMDRPLPGRLAQAHEAIVRAVASTDTTTTLGADAEAWARRLAERSRLEPPEVDLGRARWEDLGPAQVDCTHMGGITFTTMEWGRPIIRDGRRMVLHLPAGGDVELLRFWPRVGCSPVEAELRSGEVVSIWEWPLVKGNQALEAEAQTWQHQIRDGADRVAAEVRLHNDGLESVALKAINERREYLRKHNAFLEGMSIPTAPRADAPQRFSVPEVTRRRTAATRLADAAPEVPRGPQLGALYDEILRNIRAMGKTFERAPGSYADKDEEALRDHFLSILNTNFEGQAHAESFNVSGKTDLLIRVADQPLFVGECKIWSGPRGMDAAIDQLLGYTTWRDSRLALVIFVPAADFHAVVEKGREVLAARSEFVSWQPHDHPGELRCLIRWPNDPDRHAVLTTMFFHLPRHKSRRPVVAA